jgi:hypothetical protein
VVGAERALAVGEEDVGLAQRLAARDPNGSSRALHTTNGDRIAELERRVVELEQGDVHLEQVAAVIVGRLVEVLASWIARAVPPPAGEIDRVA